MGVDRPRVTREVVPPHRCQQLLAPEDLPSVAHEEREQIEFLRLELDLAAVERDAVLRAVQHQPIDLGSGVGLRGLSAPGTSEHRAHARDQLTRRKRLREVVISTDLEADDLVQLAVARGQHDHGNVALPAQRARDLESVPAGQHDVEDHQVGTRLAERHKSLIAVVRSEDLEALLPECVPERVTKIHVVVDDEKTSHRAEANTGQLIHGANTSSSQIATTMWA